MSLSFDLSSVLQLVGSRTANNDEHGKYTNSPTSEDAAFHIVAERRLGDFSSLWDYLSSSKFVPTGVAVHHDDDDDNRHQGGDHQTTNTAKIKALNNFPETAFPLTPLRKRVKESKSIQDSSDLGKAHLMKLSPLSAVLPTAAAATTPKSAKKSKATKSYSAVPPPSTLTTLNTRKKSPEKASLHTPSSSKGTRPTITSSIPSEQRKLLIVQKLLARFPQDRGTLLQPVKYDGKKRADDIHVFVDNSNIIISFVDYIKETHGFHKMDFVRRPTLSFHGLSLVLERGRRVTRRVLAGSSPVTKEIVEACDLGYETCILDRVEKEIAPEKDSSSSASSGSETSVSRKKTRYVEQGVDELLHMKMLESIIDYKPSTVVLASGDGAPAEFSMGFFHVLLRYLMQGWKVEVVAFRKNLNKNYRDPVFQRRWGAQFELILLDDFAEELLM